MMHVLNHDRDELNVQEESKIDTVPNHDQGTLQWAIWSLDSLDPKTFNPGLWENVVHAVKGAYNIL